MGSVLSEVGSPYIRNPLGGSKGGSWASSRALIKDEAENG